jgi:hypothetical protein
MIKKSIWDIFGGLKKILKRFKTIVNIFRSKKILIETDLLLSE